MAGMSDSGFTPKRLNEIIEGLKATARPIFQDLVQPGEEVDTGDTSTIGRFIGLIAPDLSELWQAAQEVYQAFDPNSATGIALDNIVQYIGVERRQGKPTSVAASLWGNIGVYLPEGQVARTDGGDRFQSNAPLTFSLLDSIGGRFTPSSTAAGIVITLTFITGEAINTVTHTNGASETVTNIITDLKSKIDAIPASGVNTIIDGNDLIIQLDSYYGYISFPVLQNISALQAKKRSIFYSEANDSILAPIGSLRTILTPVFGWTSINNELAAVVGSKYETDEELRERFKISKAVRASNMADSLYSRLIELESVQAVRVYENMTNATDLQGLPPHSFMAMVRGGSNSDIGKIVWDNKPLGIASYGEVESTITDSQGRNRIVYFSRATDVAIKVKIVVTKTDNNFPDEGALYIREAVKAYLDEKATFGEDVIYTRLFTPINTVPGHQVDSLQIAKGAGAFGTSNIAINWNEYPVISDADIEVTVTNP